MQLAPHTPAVASNGSDYAQELRTELRRLWMICLKRRAPHVADWVQTSELSAIPTGVAASPYLQALSIWFQLLRIIEENAAIRARRLQETVEGLSACDGTFAQSLQAQNAPLPVVKQQLSALRVGPTLTAHPTEAKRVTVLEIHRRIYRTIVKLEADRWTPNERQKILSHLESEIDLLWMTGELRIAKPELQDEIEWGLQFFKDAIFDAVPEVADRFHTACEDVLGQRFDASPCIRFHSWIGGDRDGNPSVTTQRTEYALKRGRETARDHYIAALGTAAARLSVSGLIMPMRTDDADALRRIIAKGPTQDRNPNEPFRQALSAMSAMLRENGYKFASDFVTDLEVVDTALRHLGAHALADRYIQPLRQNASVFGFRTTTLDIRQNSTMTTKVLREIWALTQDCPEFGSTEWSELLRTSLASSDLKQPNPSDLSEDARELLSLLKLMKQVREGADPLAIGPFILSMTRSADDLLAVFLLARYAGFGSETLDLAVVPLFETIDDLRNAPAILSTLLDVPIARRSLKAQGNSIEVMLGYSDSSKDGGFFCSTWELERAQRRITNALQANGLGVAFFHGRGGSVSRGGAPTGRAIAAQPAGTISGPMRITEQGEVVSAKYANRGTAGAHLELLAASVLKHTLHTTEENASPEFDDALDALSELSRTAYVKLLETPSFLEYFQSASPVEELARLKMGSRPSKRFGAASLDDLRAIPWVFAWSQNRHLITGWYGFGTAMKNFRQVRGSRGDGILRAMFKTSPLFRLCVDEIEKTLYQTDLHIASRYASLVESETIRDRIFDMVASEYVLACEAVSFLTESAVIGQRFPMLTERFERKRAALDKIHALQVQLLTEYRKAKDVQPTPIALLQSMNAVSAGLGWTG